MSQNTSYSDIEGGANQLHSSCCGERLTPRLCPVSAAVLGINEDNHRDGIPDDV